MYIVVVNDFISLLSCLHCLGLGAWSTGAPGDEKLESRLDATIRTRGFRTELRVDDDNHNRAQIDVNVGLDVYKGACHCALHTYQPTRQQRKDKTTLPWPTLTWMRSINSQSNWQKMSVTQSFILHPNPHFHVRPTDDVGWGYDRSWPESAIPD